MLAAETARATARHFHIVAVDQADIDPAAFVSRHGEDYAAIIFLRDSAVEALPFPKAAFNAVISQYGIEYSDLEHSVPEAARLVASGGRVRFVVHAADGGVAEHAQIVIAEADLLLDEIDLPGAAARCFTAVLAVEREPHAGAPAAADAAFVGFQAALERTAAQIEKAEDQVMFRNSGAVLLDTYQRRMHFDLDQLLAKAAEVKGEIVAHRGRLQALVDAALDEAGARDLAERFRALGAVWCNSRPLENAAGLIGHVVEATF